ncbi:hypothetical protein JXR93_09605 [bacterium]|nr:hypothetical protein [bacterium]
MKYFVLSILFLLLFSCESSKYKDFIDIDATIEYKGMIEDNSKVKITINSNQKGDILIVSKTTNGSVKNKKLLLSDTYSTTDLVQNFDIPVSSFDSGSNTLYLYVILESGQAKVFKSESIVNIQ